MNINKNARRILIYGDSYTFGKIPGGVKYDSSVRFTGQLQKILGENYEIIEEGLRGRMLDADNAFFPFRNGLVQFGPILGSHLPLDLVILFLGTNDCNSGSGKSAEDIVSGFDTYLSKVDWWAKHLEFPIPKIMIVAPPVVAEKYSYKIFNDIFKGSQEVSKTVPLYYKNYAKKHKLEFFDASKVVKVSPIDGIHLDEKANKLLAQSLAEKIISIFK